MYYRMGIHDFASGAEYFHDVVESGYYYFVEVHVVFPSVCGVVLDRGGSSCIDDTFSGRWYDGLEGYWYDVVVLLDCTPLVMFQEASDEAEMGGVLWAWYLVR